MRQNEVIYVDTFVFQCPEDAEAHISFKEESGELPARSLVHFFA